MSLLHFFLHFSVKNTKYCCFLCPQIIQHTLVRVIPLVWDGIFTLHAKSSIRFVPDPFSLHFTVKNAKYSCFLCPKIIQHTLVRVIPLVWNSIFTFHAKSSIRFVYDPFSLHTVKKTRNILVFLCLTIIQHTLVRFVPFTWDCICTFHVKSVIILSLTRISQWKTRNILVFLVSTIVQHTWMRVSLLVWDSSCALYAQFAIVLAAFTVKTFNS